MPSLTERDKRTIRLASIAVAAYLVLFFGIKLVRNLESSRTSYQQLVLDARVLQQELETYKTKAEVVKKLRGDAGVNLTELPSDRLMGETATAIQKAAQSSGVKMGPIRENAGRRAAGEIGSMQLEASGPVQGVFGFLDQLDSLGYPVIIDSVQFGSERRPGQLKVDIDMVIIDFTRWSEQERRNNV